MSVGKKLMSNTAYLFLDWLSVSLMGFFYWFIAGKTLLPEEYGVVSTSVNLAAFLSTISLLGINTALWKLLPEYEARKEKGKSKQLIKFSFQIALLTNLLILLIFVGFSNTVSSALKIPTCHSIDSFCNALFNPFLSFRLNNLCLSKNEVLLFIELFWSFDQRHTCNTLNISWI